MRSNQQNSHPTSLGFEFLCINDLHKGSQKNVGINDKNDDRIGKFKQNRLIGNFLTPLFIGNS
jgi:hypothetical protein